MQRMLRAAVVAAAIMGAGAAAAQAPGGDAPPPSGVRAEAGTPRAGGPADRAETPAEAARRGVLDELERLRAEVAMLKALREVQEALFAWNGLRVRSGERPAALDDGLCRTVGAWCGALPASFGRTGREGSG